MTKIETMTSSLGRNNLENKITWTDFVGIKNTSRFFFLIKYGLHGFEGWNHGNKKTRQEERERDTCMSLIYFEFIPITSVIEIHDTAADRAPSSTGSIHSSLLASAPPLDPCRSSGWKRSRSSTFDMMGWDGMGKDDPKGRQISRGGKRFGFDWRLDDFSRFWGW